MKMRTYLESEPIRRSNFYCTYCGEDLLENPRLFESFVLDHLVPRSRGGSDDDCNRMVACAACDRWKKSHPTTTVAEARTLLVAIRLRTMVHLEHYRFLFRAAGVEGGRV
ncbi:MAG: HNH endonuclease [Planctomycetia bacterium]|nr:HNH endonuclease [Planctomycetia bacterium]